MAAAAGSLGVSFHPVARGGTFPNEYRDIQITFGVAPPTATTFTLNPTSRSGVLGQTVIFTAVAAGNPLPVYQWQVRPSGTTNWFNLANNATYSGVTTTNLSVTLTALALSGNAYQCIASNTSGSATSAPPAVLTVTPALLISTLAGQAGNGGTGNGIGTNATFFYPFDLVCDPAGNVYVAEYYDGAVRKMTPSGVVTTFTSGFNGPEGIAIDAATNLYVTDTFNEQIVRVAPNGVHTVLAGLSGVAGSADGVGTLALFGNPWGIAVDAATNVYVADSSNNIIRKLARIGITQNWAVTTIAGLANVAGSADGANSAARFNLPANLAVDASNNLYVCDAGNNTIRKMVNTSGTNWTVTTLAGSSTASGSTDGVGSNALFYNPSGITVDGAGNLYVMDSYNDLVRFITPQGVVTTLAGDYFVDGAVDGFYTNAQFNGPEGIAIDPFGNIYIADTFNYTIREASVAQVTAPTLAILLTNSAANISWPVATQAYHLQSSASLSMPNWTNNTAATSIIANYYNTTNAVHGSPMYFRLTSP